MAIDLEQGSFLATERNGRHRSFCALYAGSGGLLIRQTPGVGGRSLLHTLVTPGKYDKSLMAGYIFDYLLTRSLYPFSEPSKLLVFCLAL